MEDVIVFKDGNTMSGPHAQSQTIIHPDKKAPGSSHRVGVGGEGWGGVGGEGWGGVGGVGWGLRVGWS